MKNYSLLLRTAIAAASLALASCDDGGGAAPSRSTAPIRVLVEPLAVERAATRVEAVGTSRAVRSVEIYPAAAGEVNSVHFSPGQFVQQDDLLVELDKRDEVLAVDAARVRLEDAERLFTRYQRSGNSGAVLPTEIDAARTAVESARIELQRARVALDERTIRAPIAGHVDVTDIFPGDRINPATLITTIDDRSVLLVSFAVPEVLISDLAVGGDVVLATWNRGSETFTGEIVEISSRIDAGTRTFLTRATVANAADQLRPGMSFRVTVSVAGAAHPVVTETAVQWGADGAYIWTVDAGTAARLPVEIVQRQEGRVLLNADAEAGTLVVVEGIQRMRPGLAVSYDEFTQLGAGEGSSEP